MINKSAVTNLARVVLINEFVLKFLLCLIVYVPYYLVAKIISNLVDKFAENGLQGKRGKVAYLDNWSKPTPLAAGESSYDVTFEWDESIGVPGAFVIKNNHHSEFYLKTLTLEDVPNHGPVQFVCFSWVYPAGNYNYERIFFTNQAYLPSQTPGPLLPFREAELKNLRGDGTGERKEWDRVYDYDYYNDLGDPDNGKPRPILGGNSEYPYPRRGRTGRKMTKTGPPST